MASSWDAKLDELLSAGVITGYALTSQTGTMLAKPQGHLSLPDAGQVCQQMRQSLSFQTTNRAGSSSPMITFMGYRLQMIYCDQSIVRAIAKRRRYGMICSNLRTGLIYITFSQAGHGKFSVVENALSRLRQMS